MKATENEAEFLTRYGKNPVTYKALFQAWDQFADVLKNHKAKLAALEQEIVTLKARPLLKDAGLWRHGGTYALGDVAQFSGSPWVCTKAHTATGPTADHSCWRLWLKSGRDGKDLR